MRLFIAILLNENMKAALTETQENLRRREYRGRYTMIRKMTAAVLAAMILCLQPIPAAVFAEDVFYDDTSQHESYPDNSLAEPVAELPRGWLLWHSYSSYAALDSKLYLRSPDGSITELSGDFVHAMNGNFGTMPEQITFMAIDPSADEWDIFLYDSGWITNLTQNSGFRNEDPKFSPDGKNIMFKRGQWDSRIGDFVYNLALLDIAANTVTILTDDMAEEAMPCFSADGKFIYYTSYTNGIGSIIRMDLTTHKPEMIFSENGVNAYYPIVQGNLLYFTKWYSAENRCDQLVCYDGNAVTALPFDSEHFDCSDACPVGDTAMIYSSTAKVGYDLYFYDGKDSVRLDLNSDNNELGADFFAEVRGDVNCDGVFGAADVVLLQKWLIAVPDTHLKNWKAADFCEDNRLNVFDLCLMKRELLNQYDYNS